MKRMLLPPGAIAGKTIAAILVLAAVGTGAMSVSVAVSPADISGVSPAWQSLPYNGLALLQLNTSNTSGAGATDGWEETQVEGARRAELLTPLQAVQDWKIILDISPEPAEYIPGAISIPYTDFLSNGSLKTAPEMGEILGGAGISQDDAVLIYGECQPCGGGPSAATYVYWIMKYLGHRNVSLLDGGMDDWVKAGYPTSAQAQHMSPANYNPSLKTNLLASYSFVKGGGAQIIDARGEAEFKAGSIPCSINIPYDLVLEGKKIKDDVALSQLFSSLDKKRPVVVYTNTGVKASMIWLALTLLDYDASIYSWRDWQANSPSDIPDKTDGK